MPEFSGFVDSFVETFSESLYVCAKDSRVNSRDFVNDAVGDRRERMLQDRDDSRIWQAVNWSGDFDSRNSSNDTVSDNDLKFFFESTLTTAVRNLFQKSIPRCAKKPETMFFANSFFHVFQA